MDSYLRPEPQRINFFELTILFNHVTLFGVIYIYTHEKGKAQNFSSPYK